MMPRKTLTPLYVTEKRDQCEHINLLLIREDGKAHYCWIKNFSRLMGGEKKDKCKHYYCQYCFYHSNKSDLADEHAKLCRTSKGQIFKFPDSSNNTISTRGIQTSVKIPFVIYADFECLLVSVDGDKKQKHEPSGFAYKIVESTGNLNRPVELYRGPNVAETFLDMIFEEENWILKEMKKIKSIEMSPEERTSYKKTKKCHVCKKIIKNKKDKTADHCHLTGKYRGAAHKACNLNFRKPRYIPVVFHNLSGYDGHIIMQANKKFKGRKIECIPESMETYISFTIGSLRFIDSNRFLNSSLDKLVDNLNKLKADISTKFYHTSSLASRSKDKLELLVRKQVYPYEYMDSVKKFEESKLPSQKDFYSCLKDEHITDDDYKQAKEIWEKFGLKTLGEYHDLYVQTDVLLLADVFENFRKTSLEHYGLDPAHFYSTPGLAWQSALKMTEVKIELLTDPDMHQMIESGIRGGVAMISHRKSTANLSTLPNHDPTKPNKYIIYLDANNLYGWAMSQPLPLNDFRWLSDEEISGLDIPNIADNSATGYIFEVDLTYPEELHDEQNDFPLAPEKIPLTADMLSPFCKDLLSKLDIKEPFGDRLIPNLRSKKKYVVHYQALKLYLKLGMKLTKVYRAISFRQTTWLKSYIDFNTDKRKEAADDVVKDFFKLMNNSVYGKTLENVKKYKNVKFVTNSKMLTKLTAKPLFDHFRIFNENLIAVEMRKRTVSLMKPIHVGFSILDLAKTFIYNFHYNVIKKRYGAKAKLLFTDTDSLCYEIETKDVYNDMKDDKDLYDFSNYPPDHDLFNNTNQNVVGKMKDETKSVPIEAFVGLRAKMYALKYDDGSKITAQGVNRPVSRKIRFENFEKCLGTSELQRADSVKIESRDHKLATTKSSRVTLSPYDDKRYISQDGIKSLAYGNCAIGKDPNF